MEAWRRVASSQGGLITRTQLREVGVERWVVRRRIETERWVAHSATVVATTTGTLRRDQLMWLGVLHAGPGALVGDLTAAELAGLRNWHREDVTILVPAGVELDPVPGVAFRRTRRPLAEFKRTWSGIPTCRLEPAVLHFAAYQPSRRTAQGLLAACVQQRLTTPEALMEWIPRMQPLRWARLMQRALLDVAGGAQSLAEMDVRRMCRSQGLLDPRRQRKRRDAAGHVRFTDCEWELPGGRVIVLEVDGGFHMETEQWEDDLARARRITSSSRTVVRCTARELRDEPDLLARDLRALGVPRR